jgi:hypothetical protein
MRPEQLCFFKFPRPLLERFGKDFFRNIPKSPGVYVLTGERRRVLYVGQSKNLRERLSYYKNAQPEREPRRIIRLVHETIGIEVECCESAEAARLRELALIGQHRPRFNVANTLSPTFTFFGLRQRADQQDCFSVRLSMKPAQREDELLVGAFRNRGLCSRAFCAMARTVVAHQREIQTVFDFPLCLNGRATEWDGFEIKWRESLEAFLRGEDAALLEHTIRLAAEQTDPFLKQLFEADLLSLTEFFSLAHEMNEARRFHDLPALSNEALQVSAWQMRLRGKGQAESSRFKAVSALRSTTAPQNARASTG